MIPANIELNRRPSFTEKANPGTIGGSRPELAHPFSIDSMHVDDSLIMSGVERVTAQASLRVQEFLTRHAANLPTLRTGAYEGMVKTETNLLTDIYRKGRSNGELNDAGSNVPGIFVIVTTKGKEIIDAEQAKADSTSRNVSLVTPLEQNKASNPVKVGNEFWLYTFPKGIYGVLPDESLVILRNGEDKDPMKDHIILPPDVTSEHLVRVVGAIKTPDDKIYAALFQNPNRTLDGTLKPQLPEQQLAA